MRHHASAAQQITGPASNSRRPLTAKALPWISAALFALPQLCLAIDPLHPLGRSETLESIIGRVVSVILGLLGSISLVMFVYGGIVWMTAQGNDEKIKKAKGTIVYAILGLIIAFSSYGLLSFFFDDVLRQSVRTPG